MFAASTTNAPAQQTCFFSQLRKGLVKKKVRLRKGKNNDCGCVQKRVFSFIDPRLWVSCRENEKRRSDDKKGSGIMTSEEMHDAAFRIANLATTEQSIERLRELEIVAASFPEIRAANYALAYIHALTGQERFAEVAAAGFFAATDILMKGGDDPLDVYRTQIDRLRPFCGVKGRFRAFALLCERSAAAIKRKPVGFVANAWLPAISTHEVTVPGPKNAKRRTKPRPNNFTRGVRPRPG